MPLSRTLERDSAPEKRLLVQYTRIVCGGPDANNRQVETSTYLVLCTIKLPPQLKAPAYSRLSRSPVDCIPNYAKSGGNPKDEASYDFTAHVPPAMQFRKIIHFH